MHGVAQNNSVTKMLSKYWPKFEPDSIVERYYLRWKTDRFSKYYHLIRYLEEVQGADEHACRDGIKTLWTRNGELASAAGTAMHLDFERVVEGLPPPQGETVEVVQFRKWLRDTCDRYSLIPWRAEWVVYYTDERNRVVVCGQVDLVLKHTERDEFWGVDFKRTNPAPKFLGGPRHILGENPGRFGDDETGSGPFAGLPHTDFCKYTCQLNAYAHIAATQYGIDFRDRMCLLQLHRDLPAPNFVRVERLDDEMSKLFDTEVAACSSSSYT